VNDGEPRDGGRRGKKIRVDLRRNRGKTARDKRKWTRQFQEGAIESDDAATVESVRAKGALSRKRTIVIPDQYSRKTRDGIVVAMRGLVADVDDGTQRWACTVRRLLRSRLIRERHPIAVGDRVRFSPVEIAGEEARAVSDAEDLPEGVIEDVAPRQTELTRQYERRVQVIAANVDTVVILAAADQPTLRPHLIDRYLVAVHKGNMRPVVCINKADLDIEDIAAEVLERYAALGYRAVFASITQQRGIEDLRSILKDSTSAIVGQSGVGKSSLIKALDPQHDLKIGTLSDLERGRHTTTTARLLPWSFGGYVVDTPGIRQFELAEIDSREIEAYFIEFVDLIPQCRFPSCTHTHEIDCAVRAAVDDGRIRPERYDSYVRMFEECRTRERQRL
jgi:ribosome biogenesis GTPase